MNCLLIETKGRKFFTHEKNFVQLIEFSKAFNATISLVKLEEGPVLDLEQLAPAICDPSYEKPTADYQLIETKFTRRSRLAALRTASQIRKYITQKFLRRESVSLKELKVKFKRHQLTTAALCNHLRVVKKTLLGQGYQIIKIGAGHYKIER